MTIDFGKKAMEIEKTGTTKSVNEALSFVRDIFVDL